MERIKRALAVFITEKLVPLFAVLPKCSRDFLMFISEKFYVGLWRSIYYKPALKRQLIGSTSFKLWLIGQNPGAQITYNDVEAAKRGEVYEVLMVECLTQILATSKNPVFIDVGSYMGYYACYVSGYLQNKFPVYAIESNPDYCKFIKKSAQENSFNNLRIFEAVLSDKEEILRVYKETVSLDNPDGKKIKAITLDNLCRNENIKPTILKIDVHGAEGKVIAGAKEILKKSVEFVLFELHPDDYLQKYSPGYNRQQILSILEECGFKNYLIGGFRYPRSPERELFKKTGQISYLEITPENKQPLFFDRHVDLFIFSIRNIGISSLKFLSSYTTGFIKTGA